MFPEEIGASPVGRAHLDGDSGGVEVERMFAQHVLEAQQVHVGAQRHFAHAIRVEVKLVLDDLREVLQDRSAKNRCCVRENVETSNHRKPPVCEAPKKHTQQLCGTGAYPVDLVTFLERVAPAARALECGGALCLEPHALHLVQVLHS